MCATSGPCAAEGLSSTVSNTAQGKGRIVPVHTEDPLMPGDAQEAQPIGKRLGCVRRVERTGVRVLQGSRAEALRPHLGPQGRFTRAARVPDLGQEETLRRVSDRAWGPGAAEALLAWALCHTSASQLLHPLPFTPFPYILPPPSAATLTPPAPHPHPFSCLLSISGSRPLPILPSLAPSSPPHSSPQRSYFPPSPHVTPHPSSCCIHPPPTPPTHLLSLQHPLSRLLWVRSLSSDLGLLSRTRAPLAAALPLWIQEGLDVPRVSAAGPSHLGQNQGGLSHPSMNLCPQSGQKRGGDAHLSDLLPP